ncbi:putative D-Xylulose kinase, partial [Aureobasidium melanogenum]
MTYSGPLYLGFDLSTQQLKGLVVDDSLKKVHEAKFDFDADAKGFNITKGVMTNEAEHEVFAPVAMWLQAIDVLLTRLKDDGLDFKRIKAISGSGMQHGSVFWNADAEHLLAQLDPNKTLETQALRRNARSLMQFSVANKNWPMSREVKRTTASPGHRFYGSNANIRTSKFAPFDISDVCGMNLWDIKAGKWHGKLLELAAGPSGVEALKQKLGDVPEDGGAHLGTISKYFVQRHGFSSDCTIIASTGDNPSTILSLPLRSNDAMVSLGTSTTFLMSTPEYKPDPSYHFFNSPTTPGLYMFMLCYKNGGLARERVRDAINSKLQVAETDKTTWANFDTHLSSTPPLAQDKEGSVQHLALYFPRPEIIPDLPAGEWHFSYDPKSDSLTRTKSVPQSPEQDARVIVESQFLSLRLRSQHLVKSPAAGLPPQPRRVYLVGGGSRNKAIAKVAGEVLGGSEGVFKLDVGENACALGAAYKAVWAMERTPGETFEDFIGKRWREDEFVEKIADGYNKDVWDRYGLALKGFENMELTLLAEEEAKRKKNDMCGRKALKNVHLRYLVVLMDSFAGLLAIPVPVSSIIDYKYIEVHRYEWIDAQNTATGLELFASTLNKSLNFQFSTPHGPANLTSVGEMLYRRRGRARFVWAPKRDKNPADVSANRQGTETPLSPRPGQSEASLVLVNGAGQSSRACWCPRPMLCPFYRPLCCYLKNRPTILLARPRAMPPPRKADPAKLEAWLNLSQRENATVFVIIKFCSLTIARMAKATHSAGTVYMLNQKKRLSVLFSVRLPSGADSKTQWLSPVAVLTSFHHLSPTRDFLFCYHIGKVSSNVLPCRMDLGQAACLVQGCDRVRAEAPVERARFIGHCGSVSGAGAGSVLDKRFSGRAGCRQGLKQKHTAPRSVNDGRWSKAYIIEIDRTRCTQVQVAGHICNLITSFIPGHIHRGWHSIAEAYRQVYIKWLEYNK